MAAEATPRELTIAEAAAHLGVSKDTIRRRLRAGSLNGSRRARPQGFAWVVEVSEQPRIPPAAADSAGLALELARLQEQVTALREAFSITREEVVARRREVEELRRQLENAYDRMYAIVAAMGGGEPGAAPNAPPG